jgi:hypothetical protein
MKAGFNASTITGKNVAGYKTKAGLYFGGLVQIPVTAALTIQPEVYYSSEGTNGKMKMEKQCCTI